ncbi:hypothetical protein COU59_01745 [Candidatus Pacearchaeota archaeon CG10_big_fil_rev_8_21_14_0_10_34_12]|nr:MAG: hypothetical protein COU59_01745 [Candidatus Pacearchaeota archaeon CG10_big_fil_rev_8_21_14_0_10_34_12]
MNLAKKKSLAARTFSVGEKRIVFIDSRKSEIKEAITKQDMRDLKKDGAILIKEVKGRKKNSKKSKRGVGKIRRKVNSRKKEYVIMTRKLRKYISNMKKEGNITLEEAKKIRKKIRNSIFRSKNNLKTHLISSGKGK